LETASISVVPSPSRSPLKSVAVPMQPQLRRITAAPKPSIPRAMSDRMALARDRIRAAAEQGRRMRAYEVALDLDMSEFHFARQFRVAFGQSPHAFFDELRAGLARMMLANGCTEGVVARRIGFRRPAELRALLAKRRGESQPSR
jgi:hypothetical protein